MAVGKGSWAIEVQPQPDRHILKLGHVSFPPLPSAQQFGRVGARHADGSANPDGRGDAAIIQSPPNHYAQSDGL
jgi:hypothetical protein